MNYRDKFLVQIMVCLAIFVGLRGIAIIDDEGFSEIKSTLNRYISKNYSLEEIKENGAELLDKITSAPAVLAGKPTR